MYSLIRFAMGSLLLFGSGVWAVSQEVSLETPTGKLYGTLELPTGSGPFPAVLIHPGSGPTDRDGNSAALPGKNDSLKLLAEGLAKNGIASLRIDKRGIAKSVAAAAREQDLRFDTYIEDARGWLDWLRKDNRFSRLAVIGHSEGSLIGMVAAQGKADAFVSLAGIARPADAVLVDQLAPQLTPAQLEEVRRVLGELKAGRPVPQGQINLPVQVNVQLFRDSVQPYLISSFRYDPAREITRLNIPVLLVQGTTDLQVPVSEAQALSRAKPTARLVLVEGMNHVLKTAPADPQANFATYSNPSLPLAPGLLEPIVTFLRDNLK